MHRYNYSFQFVAAVVRIVAVTTIAFTVVCAQDPPQPQAKAPESEVKAVAAITAAPDVAAKLTQAEAFAKKYPKSTLRPQVVLGLTSDIGKVADDAQRLVLGERFLTTFSNDPDSGRIKAMVVGDYIRAKRVDDAFTLGTGILAKEPENLPVLSVLAIAGAEQVRKQNAKYSTQTWQYGQKAIELIEANKKPANIDDAYWTYQQSLLPQLYLNMGTLALAGGKPAEARPRFEKAIQLNPGEPTGYVLLGGLVDDEYRVVAESYQSMKDGPEKQEAFKKATELMDKVIDLYAHALGAATGKPEYKPMYDQVLDLITPYYRYRYKSTTGLQPLIDKYKAPAKP